MLQPGTLDTSLAMRCGIVETVLHELLSIQTAKPLRADPERVLGSCSAEQSPNPFNCEGKCPKTACKAFSSCRAQTWSNIELHRLEFMISL